MIKFLFYSSEFKTSFKDKQGSKFSIQTQSFNDPAKKK